MMSSLKKHLNREVNGVAIRAAIVRLRQKHLRNLTIAALITALITALLTVVSGCALTGYQVGNKSLYGQDIRTVHVPIFASDVISRDAGERLTEAICKRIEARSPYKVVGHTNADSILEGRITKSSQSTSLTNSFADPRQKTGTIVVQIRWRDRRHRDLRDFEPLPFHEGGGSVTATGYLVPEIGQSEITWEQEQINRLADQIVGMMEAPW